MTPEQIATLRAAAAKAGGGKWTSTSVVVWFDDGDSALIVANPIPVGGEKTA